MAKKKLILPPDTGGMLDHIVKHLADPSHELTLPAQQKLERMKTAFSLLMSHGSDLTVNHLLTTLFSLSKTQAYNDIQDAKRVFGFEQTGSNFFNRNLILHHAWQSYLRCVAKGDEKSAATFLALASKHAVKEDEEKAFDVESVMNIQYNITNNMTQVLPDAEVLSEKRKAQLKKKYLGQAIDADSEDE